jgi:catechol-2,3-dioxygenase
MPVLRHVALKSRDLRATERFYIDLLGYQVAFPHAGMLFLRTPGDDDLLNFVETDAPFDPHAGGLEHFGLHVPAARWTATLDALARAGVVIRDRRGSDAVYIRDPNGYTVELYRD